MPNVCRLLAVTGGLAAIVSTAPAEAMTIVHQRDGYTVYREAPGYCTLYYDSPSGSMTRFSYRGSTDAFQFSWVQPGFPEVATEQMFPVLFNFSHLRKSHGYGVVRYTSGDGRWGFASHAKSSFMNWWSEASTVDIILGGENQFLIERITLRGSALAVRALRACTRA